MAKLYNAPKPNFSSWEWFKFIAIRIIFPPIVLWDLVKVLANWLFGAWIGGMVLPAQYHNFADLVVSDDSVSDYDNDEVLCEKHTIITYDNAHLDTFEIKLKESANIDARLQKYIINFVGNAMCYEHIIFSMKKEAIDYKVNVVGFNLRGVGESSGKARSKDDLVTDGIAQVQRLLDSGVSPQNIILKGHSLGAGIATLVTQHFHRLGKPINLFNSRSFSSITNFVVGHIRLERDSSGYAIGHKDSIGRIILGWIIYPFVKFGVSLVKWEMEAGSAFKSIPEKYREYIVVRSRKDIRDNQLDDAVIPHYASIHKALTAERRKKKAAIRQKIENSENLSSSVDSLQKSLKEIKSDRKMETKFPNFNGHNQNLSLLHNRSGKSAQDFFHTFIQRIEEDHFVTNNTLVK